MSAPDLSVVIPAYNREKTVRRAIESVLAQSLQPREIVVVDDGSQDGTRDAVLAFGDRVRYVHRENGGAAASRNTGVEAAQSDWIAFLDSDDFFLADHLSRLADAIAATGGEAAVYFADMRRSAAEGGRRLWEVCGFECAAPFELRADATEWVLLPRQPMMLQSSAFRRESYLGVGGMRADLRSRHDSHLFFKLCIGQPSCAVNHCGTEMTADDESGGRVTEAIGTRTPEYHLETVRLYRDVIDSFPHLSARYRAALRGRLSSAHVWLSKHRFGEWRLLRGVSHLAAATVASPRRVFGGLGRKARPTG